MTSQLIPNNKLRNLEQISYEIIEIRKKLKIGTSSLTPLNYAEEMEKFFKSKIYNPKYIYQKKDFYDYSKKIDEIKKRIEKIDLPMDLCEHLQDVMEDLRQVYFTKSSIGTEDFSTNAHNLFDWGKDRLDILLSKTPNVHFKIYEKHTMLNAEQIKKSFEKALKKYNLLDYTVKINSQATHIICAGFKSIEIGSNVKRFECNVDRLIVHEIESHILQTQNTKDRKTPIAELTKYGNQNLYCEGLAVYNEITTRKITPTAFEMYYFRIKAVRFLHKGFREIYNLLRENLSPTRAFVMTYRVKRGLSDTSKSGGFPKDACYLLGFHEIENLINEGFSKKHLYLTKSPVLSTLLLKYGIIDNKKILTPKFYR